MERCLLDTSTVSDIIQPPSKRLASISRQLKKYLRSHGRFSFSEITCYEIIRGLRKKHASAQLIQFTEFCRRAELLSVDFDVLDRAASLWAEGRRLGVTVDDGDLMIAATALEQNLPLVTSNTRHFDWISDLRLLNWREA